VPAPAARKHPSIRVAGKRYHGINVLILDMDMGAFQTGDPRSMTCQQEYEGRRRQRANPG
jgi:antirestriction protein ArdC